METPKIKVNFDFVLYEKSSKIDRNGAAQLIFLLVDNGAGTVKINGSLGEFQLPFTEPINSNEESNTEYNVVLTGLKQLLVIRKYYLNK
jgi:hypothetical protein